jgi:hypothetical protein
MGDEQLSWARYKSSIMLMAIGIYLGGSAAFLMAAALVGRTATATLVNVLGCAVSIGALVGVASLLGLLSPVAWGVAIVLGWAPWTQRVGAVDGRLETMADASAAQPRRSSGELRRVWSDRIRPGRSTTSAGRSRWHARPSRSQRA